MCIPLCVSVLENPLINSLESGLSNEHRILLNMWVVADNLRKGAATNAVQIAEFMMEKNLVY